MAEEITPQMIAAIETMVSVIEGFTVGEGADIIASVILTVAINQFPDNKMHRVEFIKHIGNGALAEILQDTAVRVKRGDVARQ